jgi:hypothetical protein
MAEVTPEVKAAQDAAVKAQEAVAAAQRLVEAQEVSMLDGITHIKQFRDGNRTEREANRLKSRYISVFGPDRWTRLCANSR